MLTSPPELVHCAPPPGKRQHNAKSSVNKYHPFHPETTRYISIERYCHGMLMIIAIYNCFYCPQIKKKYVLVGSFLVLVLLSPHFKKLIGLLYAGLLIMIIVYS